MKFFVFSIDVEDWFQVENLKKKIIYKKWNEYEQRIIISTKLILDIFKYYNIKSTFFVLGWIAEKYPKLIKLIANEGHEIASHGYNHKLHHLMSDRILKKDITKSIEILSCLSKNKIIGYRAPSFSINDNSIKLLDNLKILYDSSFNNFQKNVRYGKIKLDKKSYNINSNENINIYNYNNQIIEFPITTNKYLNINWPLGGGYFRISPMAFIKKQIKDSFRKSSIVNIYLHPWEFDPFQPRINKLNKLFRIRHYFGLRNTESKLRKFIEIINTTKDVKIVRFMDIIDLLNKKNY